MKPPRPSPRARIALAALAGWLCLPAAAQDAAGRAPLSIQRLQDPATALSRLDEAYRHARQHGDRHAEWLALADLARDTAVLDHAACEPLLALAEQAFEAALRQGDMQAAAALAQAVETTRVAQGFGPLRPQWMAVLETQAAGDAPQQAALARLQGLAALQAGQVGEALFQYQRAAGAAVGDLERAELLLQRARALTEGATDDDARQALAWLDEVDRLLPTDRYPAFIDTLLLRSAIAARRPAGAALAITLARQAAAVARQAGLPTPAARAQLALGQALLAQGDAGQAAISFEAATPEALPPAERLSRQAGLALALARSGSPEAAEAALADGEALLKAQFREGGLAAVRFLEAATQAYAALGTPRSALRTLEQAKAQRLALADEARQRLVQARNDIAGQGQALATAVSGQALLAWACAGLGAAGLALAGLALRHRHHRLRLAREALAMQQANEALSRELAARAEHLAAACHEMRQPAHVLGLLIDTAPDEAQALPGEIDEHLASVQRCGHTLADMLQPLLALSQPDPGAAPRLSPVSVGDLLAELDLQFRHAALGRGLSWHVGTSSAWVRSDRQMLRRVLFRLVAGAMRASHQGGVQVLVVTAAGQVSLDVAYSGPALQAADAADGPKNPAPAARDMARVRQACRQLGHTLSQPVSSPRGSVLRLGMAALPAPACAPASIELEALQA